MPGVAPHATHLLPDLEVVAQRFERDPSALLARAFPNTDPGSGSRAIVGPRPGMPPMVTNPLDAALTAERKRLLELGASALEVLRAEGPEATLSPEAQLGIEAIISIARPALLLEDGAFGDPPPPWDAILGPHRQSIRAAAMSVGRIGVRGLPQVPYAGTGFMVADDVVMTNCHVARLFSQLGADGDWTFQPGLDVDLDFFEDPDARQASSPRAASARIGGVIGIHPNLDLALLSLSPSEAGDHIGKPLSIMSRDPREAEGRNIYVLGYPAADYRNDASLQRSIFGDRYRVKRLQPGAVMAAPEDASIRMRPCSTGAEPEDIIFHDASTLGGNSGSCVLDLDTHQVIGLHFAGIYMAYNEAVALWRLVDDPLLTRGGVMFG